MKASDSYTVSDAMVDAACITQYGNAWEKVYANDTIAHMKAEMRDVLEAAMKAASPPESLPGWKLVPVKPTAEMVEAGASTPGMKIINGILSTHYARNGFIPIPELACDGPEDSAQAKAYTAMVNAAPSPTATLDDGK